MTTGELETLLTEFISTKVPRPLLKRIDHSLELLRGVSRSEFVRSAIQNELERFRRELAKEWERKPDEPPVTQDPDAKWILSRTGREVVREYQPSIFSLEETFELCQAHGAGRVLNWLGMIEAEASAEAEAADKFIMLFGRQVYDKATGTELHEGFQLLDKWDDLEAQHTPMRESGESADETKMYAKIQQQIAEEMAPQVEEFVKRVTERPKKEEGQDAPRLDFAIDEVRDRARDEIPQMDEY